MERTRERSRTRGPAKKPVVVPPSVSARTKPIMAKRDALSQTADKIVKTGTIPNNDWLERLFPGITASREAKTELMMGLVFTLELRGMRLAQMAQALKVSESMVNYYRSKMRDQFAKETTDMSFNGSIGRSLTTFRELQAQAAKILYSTDKNTTNYHKLRALQAAASMEKSIFTVMEKSGFLENQRLTAAAPPIQKDDNLNLVQSMILKMLTGDPDAPEEDDAPPPDPNNESLPVEEKHISLTGF